MGCKSVQGNSVVLCLNIILEWNITLYYSEVDVTVQSPLYHAGRDGTLEE